MSRPKIVAFALLFVPLWPFIGLVVVLVAAFGSTERAWNALVGFDQTVNALTGGSEDQTISARAYEAQGKGKAWGCTLCKALDLIDKDHCKKHKDT